MKRYLQAFLILIIVTLAPPVFAELVTPPPAIPAEKPEPTSSLLPSTSPISQQLSTQIQTLISGPPPASSDTTVETEDAQVEPPANFGTQVLGIVVTALELLNERSVAYVASLSGGQQFSVWLEQQTTDAKMIARWSTIGRDLLGTLIPALVAGIIVEICLYPLRRSARNRHPITLSGRFGVIASVFILRAIPILTFIGVAVSLLNRPEISKLSKFIGLNLAYALSLARVALSVWRGLLAPRSGHLRLIPIDASAAQQATAWLSGYSFVFIAAYFIMDMARAIRVPASSIMAFINILGLMIVCVTIGLIITKHRAVTQFLRGTSNQHDSNSGLWHHGLRLWVARHWPFMAISYLVVGYSIAASGIDGGLILMVRGTAITLLLLVGLRLILHWLQKQSGKETISSFKSGLTYLITKTILVSVTAAGIAASWGMDIESLFSSHIGQRFLGAGISVGGTVAILSLIYHTVSSAIDRHINQEQSKTPLLTATSRSRTILPLLRNTLYVVFIAVAVLVFLSEVGINIGPLLAGAGILGVAIGFGSQTLVKDFLTGLFIVIENAVAIGDVVKIGDHTGTVEAMSIRTIRLRDIDGVLHILPFSEVTTISNMAKTFAQSVVRVGVAYDTDLDKAIKVLADVGNELRQSPTVGHHILAPTEVLGVDELGDYSITILVRLRTHAGKQWDVKRAFLLAIKKRFDQEGITIPFPTQIQIVQKSPDS